MKTPYLRLVLVTAALVSASHLAGFGKAEPPVPNSRPARTWLPALYDRLELTQEQEQQLKTLYYECQTKINRLTGEIVKLQNDRRRAAENVLTDDQRNRLRQIQEEIRSKTRQRQTAPRESPPPLR
jgi:hypothetical protein